MAQTKRLRHEELTEIRNRAEKATEGPWFSNEFHVATEPNGYGGYPPKPSSICETFDGEYIENSNGKSDANFIAHAREDIPKLLAEIERLKTEVAVEKWKLEKICDSKNRTIRRLRERRR